jgi:hypothetical protein
MKSDDMICGLDKKYDGDSDLSDRMTILKGRTVEERPFNYDLDEMKKAMESGMVEIPDSALVSIEAFDEWLEQF